jgi:hypothetical protein
VDWALVSHHFHLYAYGRVRLSYAGAMRQCQRPTRTQVLPMSVGSFELDPGGLV